MADCIPIADFANISTFPPQVKAPIVALSVVLSVVVVVAVIVVVILFRKLSALKKPLGDAAMNLKANAASIGVGIAGGLPDTPDVGDLRVKGKLPDVDVNAAINKAVAIGGHLKGGLEGSLQVALDIGLELDNPFFTIFNALPYASLLVDTNGVIVRANAACSAKWGFPSAELEGKLYKVLVSPNPKEIEARMHAIDGLIKGQAKVSTFLMEGFDLRADGTQIAVEVFASLIQIMGKAYLFIITGHVCFTNTGQRYKEH